MSSSLAVIKGEMRGSERARVRDALKTGFDEYENVPIDQHRHRALWDLV